MASFQDPTSSILHVSVQKKKNTIFTHFWDLDINIADELKIKPMQHYSVDWCN